MVQKLDAETHRLWEQSLEKPTELSTYKQFSDFLTIRFQSLEMLTNSKHRTDINAKHSTSQPSKFTKPINSFHATADKCKYCNGNHAIFKCPQFLQLNSQERYNWARQNSRCVNCLTIGHSPTNCSSKNRCLKCKKPHHTLLHFNNRSDNISTNLAAANINISESATEHSPTPTTSSTQPFHTNSTINNSNSSTVQTYFNSNSFNNTSYNTIEKNYVDTITNVLLATAHVNATDSQGESHILRALLDSGSQASFVTEKTVQRLKLKKYPIYAPVKGLGSLDAGVSHNLVQIKLSSIYNPLFSLNLHALVLPKLTQVTPNRLCQPSNWKHLAGLPLADPNYFAPKQTDILLGNDVYDEIVKKGLIKGKKNTPVAQNTHLGWVVFGKTAGNNRQPVISVHSSQLDNKIDEMLRTFFMNEDVEPIPKRNLTQEELLCEKWFNETTTRDATGRYTVALPFKENIKPLGNSRKAAVARLLQGEKSQSKQRWLADGYKQFMNEYIHLQHMQKVTNSNQTEPIYYLPHHPVINSNSTTTKLRIVFDGSAKTDNGISLNQQLMTGPNIQDDIMSILLRFRKYKIALTADIEKMYRQVRIRSSDVDFQRILWRESDQHKIDEYQLLTVTYGTTSASYLAIRTLQQLAIDDGNKYPMAAPILLRDFYVDDIMTGCDTIQQAHELQQELIHLLAGGGFPLRKWASNNSELLNTIPPEYRQTQLPLEINSEESIKTLGVHWNPSADCFEFKINFTIESNQPITKRNLLSTTAKLFDPLGWLAPTIIIAKILLRTLWTSGLGWDDHLPEHLAMQWNKYQTNLPKIQVIKIPRWIQSSTQQISCQIHGFCDASEQAYAAVIYVRTVDQSYSTHVHMLTSKTRVAPIKPISIHRLELCGAVLLSKLLHKVQQNLQFDTAEIYAWSDSTTVLGWLKSHPSKWKTYIANRVTEVQEVVPPNLWHYIATEENPADCATRGVEPALIASHPLWWTGPQFLKTPIIDWPRYQLRKTFITDQEIRKSKLAVLQVSIDTTILTRYSTLRRLLHITAYLFRFKNNSKSLKESRLFGSLTVAELQFALHKWIFLVQLQSFPKEISCLKSNTMISKKSPLSNLNPFYHNGFLRVGGRCVNSEQSYDEKHPVILPASHHFTTLIVRKCHEETLHGGIQATLCHVRRQYWVIHPRRSLKSIISKCIVCFRYNARSHQQLMGNLPTSRVTVSRPFTNTGLDYAGPIHLRTSRYKKASTYKGFICIFICLATRAIHLEVVSDLTTNAFLAAYHRFVARRGKPLNIYSDNGTNFVGADKQLIREYHHFIKSFPENCKAYGADQGTTWHFIPPASPHFGGLWEAGVKSMKHHLRRIVGSSLLTFEELITVVTRIEGTLNSRPLCPLTSDSNDLSILTPGHFLMGTAPLSVPQDDLLTIQDNRLTRWQLLTKMYQDFWKRWSSEYLSRLQQRPKWVGKQSEIQLGDLVLLKDENLPPSRWALGRIIKKHTGSDNITRVVTLKTKETTLQRPITKICILPITDHNLA